MLIDTHAHLNDKKFNSELPQVIARAIAEGVDRIINIGYDLDSSRRTVALAEEYDRIYAVVGIHPHDAKDMTPDTLHELAEMARNPKVVAIGEIGLDYYRNLSPKEVQHDAFRAQLRLAREVRLPVVIHDRDAHNDILRILTEEKAEEIGGVLHCFSGSWEMARECIRMGFYISFAGPVTFQNARRLQEVAKLVPLDSLLVETDCPYLAPDPFRGSRNEPAYVKLVAEQIARLKNIDFETLAAKTSDNARKLFGLK